MVVQYFPTINKMTINWSNNTFGASRTKALLLQEKVQSNYRSYMFDLRDEFGMRLVSLKKKPLEVVRKLQYGLTKSNDISHRAELEILQKNKNKNNMWHGGVKAHQEDLMIEMTGSEASLSASNVKKGEYLPPAFAATGTPLHENLSELVVSRVLQGGQASRLGIQVGWMIVAIDNVPVMNQQVCCFSNFAEWVLSVDRLTLYLFDIDIYLNEEFPYKYTDCTGSASQDHPISQAWFQRRNKQNFYRI